MSAREGGLLGRLSNLLPVSRRRYVRDLEAQQREQAHLSSHVEAADRWIEGADRWQRALDDGDGEGFRGRIDTPGLELETFDDAKAGPVLGYRGADASGAGQAGFADIWRGPEERVREMQRAYIPLLEGHAPVLDVGCGRGEFLDLLAEAGIEASGVDADQQMVERAAAKGRSVVAGAADEHLAALEADSLGAVFSAQVVEHLTHEELAGFLELARERLRPGGMLIAETLNPHVPEALRNFWSDPTHVRPIFPETLLSLCLLAGYGSAYVFHPDASGDPEADLLSRPVYAVVASA